MSSTDSLGPHCDAIGITKSSVHDQTISLPPDNFLTNGVIFELHRHLKKLCLDPSHLLKWLCSLGLNDANLKSIHGPISHRNQLRSRKKLKEIVDLESQPFDNSLWVDSMETECCAVKVPVPPVLSPSKKYDNTLTYTINKKLRVIKQLETEVVSKKNDIKDLENVKAHFKPTNVKRRDSRAVGVRKERDDLSTQVSNLSADIAELNKKIAELENNNAKLCEERRSLQKRLNYHSKKLPSCDGENCLLIEKNEILKDKCAVLESRVRELESKSVADCQPVTLKEDGTFTPPVRSCILELLGLETATAKIAPTIQAVAKWIFNTHFKSEDLPQRTTCQHIADEGHVLAQQFIGQQISNSKAWGIHKDGTTRRKRKILDTAVKLEDGTTYSLGFSTVASETGKAIAEDTISKVKEVLKEDESLKSSVQCLKYTMNDRARNEQASNRHLVDWRDELLANSHPSSPSPLMHFFCMAHVLLGFHSEAVKDLTNVQRQFSDNGRLGRDLHPGFKLYLTDKAAPRFCVSASNAFAPIGDYLGVRDIWDAFCQQNNITSTIQNYKDNRFNGLFATAAAIVYHRDHFLAILRKLPAPNKKLHALLKDLEDDKLMVIMTGLAIFYVRITGPYWSLVTSKKSSYLSIRPLIKQLLDELHVLQSHPNQIVTPQSISSLSAFRFKHDQKFLSIIPSIDDVSDQLSTVLASLASSFITLIDRQLGSYLNTPVTPQDLSSTSFAPATNLISENNFGHFDSSEKRRPAASMHHHSTVHMLKRGRIPISNWIGSMSSNKQSELFSEARKAAPIARLAHQTKASFELSKALEKIRQKKSIPRPTTEESDDDDEDEPEEPPLPVSVNEWVAVAYPEGWYPGIVAEELPEDRFRINFGYWCSNRKDIKWPDKKDVQDVHRVFIFHVDLELKTKTIRTWFLEDELFNTLKEEYRSYRAKHF